MKYTVSYKKTNWELTTWRLNKDGTKSLVRQMETVFFRDSYGQISLKSSGEAKANVLMLSKQNYASEPKYFKLPTVKR